MNVRQMGRAAAAVGALVAAGAAALVAVGGVANAAGAGRCTDNVNVREEPDISSKIVAVCERGQAVQVGKTSDGFVQLTDLGGWAAQEYVSVDGHPPAAPANRSTTAKPKPAAHEHGTAHGTGDAAGDAPDGTATPTDDPAAAPDGDASAADSAAATQPANMRGALGSLLS
jgi:Bacterial SH3 domain